MQAGDGLNFFVSYIVAVSDMGDSLDLNLNKFVLKYYFGS